MGGAGQETTGQSTSRPQPILVVPAQQPATTPSQNPANPTAPTVETITFSTFKTPSAAEQTKTYLQYPRDLSAKSDSTDYVRFLFKQYNPPFSANGTQTANRGTLDGYNRSAANLTPSDLPAIALYMPEDIQAQYGAQWGGRSIQNLTANMLIGAGSITDPGQFINNLKGSLGSVAESTFYGAINEVVGQLQKTGQGEGLNTNDIFGSVGGIVLNPNTELLFQGFDLRTFTLSFKLVPFEQGDDSEIRKIIATFKQAMLPKINEGRKAEDSIEGVANATGTQNFIGVPDLVDVTFMQGAAPNPWITQFKPCAITSLNVNYTPDGSYSTYRNGSPVAITLQIGFSETKLVYREDINSNGGSF